MNILIADSGSTKTDWALVDEAGDLLHSCQTQGLNPFHMSDADILGVLQTELSLPATPDEVCFYGSGVTPEMSARMSSVITEVFPRSCVRTGGDLLAAARSLLGRAPGIACILGTGANSCFYDGSEIVLNTPPLGYILGDEGSGAVLGKLFLNGIFKGSLPASLKEAYLSWAGLDYPSIINKVYRQPLANRYLATIAPFISQAIAKGQAKDATAEECEAAEALDALVRENFEEFFARNITSYLEHMASGQQDACGNLKIGFVGSIAHYFERQLRSVFKTTHQLHIADIQTSPMQGLIRYHTQPT